MVPVGINDKSETMSNDIYVLIEHRDGKVSENSYEILGKARSLADASGGEAVALVLGQGVAELVSSLGAAHRALVIEGDSVANFTPPGYITALKSVLEERNPLLTMLPNTAVGMDVAAGLSGALNLPLAAYAIGVEIADAQPTVLCQTFGGKINTEVQFEGGRGLITVNGGAFPADEGRQDGTPSIENLAAVGEAGTVVFKQIIEPEAGDVDISKEDILVSVGRGIEEKDNIELAEELAEALGGAVSASRPVVDAGWLPKTRQVGKSGQIVKPKLYIAVGISGAPEHLEGMRDAELIIAINSDPAAPIFRTAHYGVVGDLFEILPVLAEKVGEAS